MLTVAALTAAAVIGERRLPQWRGRVAIFAGVPATAIAIGFAPHLGEGGPLLVRVATLVLAVAGIGLTVGGTVIATRARWLAVGSRPAQPLP